MAGGVQMADDLMAYIPALIEKGGLPATVGGALLLLVYKFGVKRDDTEASLTAALNALSEHVKSLDAKIQHMDLKMTEKFTRVETKVERLERDK